jgi:Uma2 family endonuclease
MIAQPQHLKMSVEAYLALDRESQDVRYEYIDGYAYLLAGGTPVHALIAANLISEINTQLRGGPCRVYTSDAKVRISQKRYVFPDITVSCDERDHESDAEALHYPRLVIEILSPSTEAYDRGNKSSYYRACATIQEYVLVSTQKASVEVYRRTTNKLWTLYPFGRGEQIELASIGVTLPIAAIYENVRLSQEPDDSDTVE